LPASGRQGIHVIEKWGFFDKPPSKGIATGVKGLTEGSEIQAGREEQEVEAEGGRRKAEIFVEMISRVKY